LPAAVEAVVAELTAEVDFLGGTTRLTWDLAFTLVLMEAVPVVLMGMAAVAVAVA
jgi:hypothetical protein